MDYFQIIDEFALDTSVLVRYRSVSKEWNANINNLVPRLSQLTKTAIKCKEALVYDKEIYDNQWYKRKLASKYLADTLNTYKQMRMPILESYDLDLGDAIVAQYCITRSVYPDEYYVLLYYLTAFPSTNIYLYPIDQMKKLCNQQTEWLKGIVLRLTNESELNNILLFNPLCYVRLDNSFVFLCYVNLIDTLLEGDFPTDYDRFCFISIADPAEQNDSPEKSYLYEFTLNSRIDAILFPPAPIKPVETVVEKPRRVRKKKEETPVATTDAADDELDADEIKEIEKMKSGNLEYDDYVQPVATPTTAVVDPVEPVQLPPTRLYGTKFIIMNVQDDIFVKFEEYASNLTKKIVENTETRLMPKNISSNFASFAKLFSYLQK